MGYLGEQLGGVEDGFGGDASAVEARAPNVVAFDQHRVDAELGGSDCGDVAAGAGSDDCEFEVFHAIASFRSCCVLHRC